MEASAAGLAAGDGGGEAQGESQAQGQQGAEGAQAPQGDAAIAQMAQQLEGMSGGMEEMRQFFAAQAQRDAEAQTAQQEQSTPPDLGFLQDPNLDQQQAAERLQEVMRAEAGSEAQKLLQEALSPLQQQVSDMQRQQETDALVAEFPELGKPEVAQSVVAAAHQLAEHVGQPELAANTAFVRIAYMAGRAAELAQAQNGAADGSGAATLEGAGGASPGGAGQGASQPEDYAAKWGGGNNVLSKL